MKKIVIALTIVALVGLAGVFLSSPKAQTHSVASWVGQNVTVVADPYRSSDLKPILFENVRLVAVNTGSEGISEIIIQRGDSHILLPRVVIFSITKKGF
ncbi:MAG: hypothetical protein C4576_23325 [Desulfobacteraceae bacterium]|nr:MAG: hypothetical protein C4576_23325 [Desulfobacteraceae bacterium]